MSGALCDHFIGEGDTVRVFLQIRGGGLEGIKPQTDLRCLGKAVGTLVGKGADAQQGQEMVKKIRQKIDLDHFSGGHAAAGNQRP